MNAKERWLAVLNGEKPDRIPMDYWATPEATAKLLRCGGFTSFESMAEHLHIDYVVSVAPEYVGPPVRYDRDMYGCMYTNVDYGHGIYRECVYHPLAQFDTVDEIDEHYTWPTADWFNYKPIPQQIAGKDDHPVNGGGSEPFLIYCNLRGLEQAYMDLRLHPDMVEYCLDKLFALAYENTTRIYEQIPGKVTYSYVAEDFGSQAGLLFAPNVICRVFFPRMRRIMDLAHESGVYVFTHSDGAIREIIPDLIEMGIDILNPIQWRCTGMEREGLKQDFGGKVVFHGGMDNQVTLPFGTPDDVRREVWENIEILGKGGGYILAPCHNIQEVSAPESIVAMYQAGYEYGKLS
ncbi:MAG: uroporphyrinogen-III decarboxylase-like protein [Anaerolineae bacterium]|nr:uroporphyrinogen-III decarboxylase-like protein [Anaerolineae bacterium]